MAKSKKIKLGKLCGIPVYVNNQTNLNKIPHFKISLNKNKYKIFYFKDKDGSLHFTIERNGKGKMTSMHPKALKMDYKMHMFKSIKDFIEFDIQYEIEQNVKL